MMKYVSSSERDVASSFVILLNWSLNGICFPGICSMLKLHGSNLLIVLAYFDLLYYLYFHSMQYRVTDDSYGV